jgi:hypothetical protein
MDNSPFVHFIGRGLFCIIRKDKDDFVLNVRNMEWQAHISSECFIKSEENANRFIKSKQDIDLINNFFKNA